jgi:hypothetical protein
MTWVGVFKAALIALSALAGFLKNRQLLDAGVAEHLSRVLVAALDDLAKANDARGAVRSIVLRDPARLREDDGFRRSD